MAPPGQAEVGNALGSWEARISKSIQEPVPVIG